MRKTIILVSLLAVAACSTDPTTIAANNAKVLTQIATVTQAVCQVDAQAQPVVVTLAAPVVTALVPSSAAVVAGSVALDTAVIHPDIIAACKVVGGVAVAATPAVVAAK